MTSTDSSSDHKSGWLRPLLELDARLSDRLRLADTPGPLRGLAVFLAHSGDSWFWGIGLLTVWLLGDSAWKYRTVAIFLAIGLLAVVVQLIKWTVRRQRPPGDWGAIYRNADPHSFPSGHAARALMLAVFGLALGPAWFAALLVIWGPLVALARVMMGVHYVSDIVAGAGLGALMGLIFAALHATLMPLLPAWLF
jgi:undecaprenyl-diphosphatase